MSTMNERKLKAQMESRHFFDEPASLRPDEYASYAVPYLHALQSTMFKNRDARLIRRMDHPSPISKTKVGA